MTALWIAVILGSLGSYALKLAGMSLPDSVLSAPRVQRVAGYLPIAMLSALVAVQLFDGGGHYAVDWRTGFVVVFLLAAGVTALLRWLT